jgi:hypothetical protein
MSYDSTSQCQEIRNIAATAILSTWLTQLFDCGTATTSQLHMQLVRIDRFVFLTCKLGLAPSLVSSASDVTLEVRMRCAVSIADATHPS